ncbi:MAG: hypothetical protein EBQ92_08405 [Proteobacteria bacterium]|nr:hypothetical protein [Pseudomonadota bacterium]
MKIAVLIFLFSTGVFATDGCRLWFDRSKIEAGSDCLTKCTVFKTDLSTFSCPERCSEFCESKSPVSKLLEKVAYYPGLTLEERKLISQYPKEALKAFLAKEKAESATMKQFKRDDEADESDAFRHFVWAGLLTKELGPEMAKKFLDAHESNQGSDNAERAMDLANNRAGLLAAERLQKNGSLTEDQIEKEALAALKDGTLIVLKPKGGPL